MKKQIAWILCIGFVILLLTACNGNPEKTEPTVTDATQEVVLQTQSVTDQSQTESGQPTEKEAPTLVMTIGETPVSVEWEDGEAVEALKEAVKTAPLTIQMSMYGGFEQVGALGTTLPTNDRETTTSPGDIVLYSGNQLVVFYGSNTWAYTRLGHITDQSESELSSLLSSGDTTITISLG